MCGINAIYLKPHLHTSSSAREGIVEKAILQKQVQQNRGQVSAGAMSLRNLDQNAVGERLPLHIGAGSVEEAFHLQYPGQRKSLVERLAGIAILGQVRYSTVYASENDPNILMAEGQPMRRDHSNPSKNFGFVYNGTLANNDELRRYLIKEKNQSFSTAVDTETLKSLMAVEIRENLARGGRNGGADLFEITDRLFQRLDGGYSVISLFADGNMLAFRGPEGIRPLKFGENGDLFAFASESQALEVLGINKCYDVPRWAAIVIDKTGKVEERRIMPVDGLPDEARCRVEAIYFARGESDWDGRKVSEVRRELGKELARGDPLIEKIMKEGKGSISDNFVIVPIPNTGRSYAEGYQAEVFRQTGVFVPLINDIEKRFPGRMFIMGAEERERLKKIGIALHGGVRNREVIALEDSLIRGKTLEGVGQKLVLEGGAKAFHARIGDQPYRYPCFYGIDFPTFSVLAVHKYGLSDVSDIDRLEVEMAKKMGIASIRFQRLDGLYRALGKREDELCMACVTGKYPTQCGQKRYEELK